MDRIAWDWTGLKDEALSQPASHLAGRLCLTTFSFQQRDSEKWAPASRVFNLQRSFFGHDEPTILGFVPLSFVIRDVSLRELAVAGGRLAVMPR